MNRSALNFASLLLALTLFVGAVRHVAADAPSDQSLVGSDRSIAGEPRAGTGPSHDSLGALPTSMRGMEDADAPTLAEAQAHYARARALLVASIAEFDKAYSIANPDLILDSKTWRGTLITRVRDLERVIDPRPRSSQGSVRFEPNSALLAGKK